MITIVIVIGIAIAIAIGIAIAIACRWSVTHKYHQSYISNARSSFAPFRHFTALPLSLAFGGGGSNVFGELWATGTLSLA